jgi:hypothetical protein
MVSEGVVVGNLSCATTSPGPEATTQINFVPPASIPAKYFPMFNLREESFLLNEFACLF